MTVTTSDIGTTPQATLASRPGTLVFLAGTIDELCAPVVSLSLPSPIDEDLYEEWDEVELSCEEVRSHVLAGSDVSLPA